MAGINQTFSLSIKDDAGRVVASESAVKNGDTEVEFNASIPGTSNHTLAMEVDVSTVVAFYIISDKALEMQENTSDLLVELAAGVAYWWYTGKGTNPFSVDVTGLKFTNAGAAAAVVHGAFLIVA